MIRRFSEQGKRTREKVQGGNGTLLFQDLFTAEELGNRLQMCSAVTLMSGESIGEHAHTENGELYYILQGTATMVEDGKEFTLCAGDAQFCADGHTHGIANFGLAPLVFLAVIMPNK